MSKLIHEQGLHDFYRIKRGSTSPPLPRGADSLAWFDAMKAEATQEGDIQRFVLDIQGVHCAACVWLLRSLVARAEGGIDLRVNSSLGRATLVWSVKQGDPREFLREAQAFGYRFGAPRRAPANELRSLTIRLGLSVALAMNVMVFMSTFYLGLPPESRLGDLFGWLSFGLTTVAVAAGGSLFIASAARALRVRVLHFDIPIALGIVSAYVGSLWAFVTAGPAAAYFDTVAIFIALMLAGRWLQATVIARNRRLLLDETGVDSLHTRRLEGSHVLAIRADRVRVGDELLIAVGDLVPVTVTALDRGVVSLDWITGESRPVAVGVGDRVAAGTLNAGGAPLRVRAEGTVRDSALSSLLEPVHECPPGADRWWERISRVYVLAVLGLALAGFTAWSFVEPSRAVFVAVAVLVVSCPCAFGIAIPLARELVIQRLRRAGVFVRRLDALDRVQGVRNVVFDKTGTLTDGRLTLTAGGRRALAELDEGDRDVLERMVATSNHPVSRALHGVLTHVRSDTPGSPAVDGGSAVIEVQGEGLAWSSPGGVTYRLGRRSFACGDSGDGGGAEATMLTRDGVLLASFELEENLHADVVAELAALRDDAYETFLWSGDRADRVARIADAAGVSADRAAGELTPDQKGQLVTSLGDDVLMVGDGVNDSHGFRAALASAAPISPHAAAAGLADLFYTGRGIAAVRRTLLAARLLRRVTRETLTIAIIYNAFVVGAAMLGRVTPLIAAIVMPISSALTALYVTRRITGGMGR